MAPVIALHTMRTPADRDDDELMLLVRGGSTEAMAALVARYHPRLYSFCAKSTRDAAAAEELVQEAFLRLWRHRASYRADGKLAVLLYTTARNLCRNHARSLFRRMRRVQPLEVPAGDAFASSEGASSRMNVEREALDALIERERRRDVEVALGALPTKLREAVLLRFEHQLAYDQIAAIVGAGESTVRSRVHLGLQRLRAHLGGRR